MDGSQARSLLSLVSDQLAMSQAEGESARCRQLGNGEHVLILETASSQWFLWSHADWQALRHRTKKAAQQQRKAAGIARRKRQGTK